MVTSAAWTDYDRDGRLDLIVAGEWMPVRAFHQESGRFVERTKEAGFDGTNGWWNTVTVADLNGDGRPDLVLGNLGLNSYLAASRQRPARLYVGDFAHDHVVQQILSAYNGSESYPVAGRDELVRTIPGLREKFPSYSAFGGRGIEDILPAADRSRATILEAYNFATSIALNTGSGYTLETLPPEAQLSSVRAALADDFDGDGHVDLLLAGNDFGVPPVFGRNDASYGVFLHGVGDGRFTPVDLPESGLVLAGQARHIRVVRQANGGRLIVVARNDDTLQVFRLSLSPSVPLLSPPTRQ